jgi:hypothetical protein
MGCDFLGIGNCWEEKRVEENCRHKTNQEIRISCLFFIFYNLNIFVYQVILFQVLYYFTCLLWIYIYIYILAIVFIIYIIFLTRELVFLTSIDLASTTSVVRILLSLFVVYIEKREKFNELNFK